MQSSNQALAIKYRPKSFQDIVGQESVSRTLTLALDTKRLVHAYLFSGLRGSGKTSTARIFAKALLCKHGESSNPCEECYQCISANKGNNIDIIEMDAASHRKIDDIRDLIEQTKYQPANARYKIFIIDEVHMLTKEAFNALLKTLEEPPTYIKFILATTDALKVPNTILSRTQHFHFKKIPSPLIVSHLIHMLDLENIEYDKESLEIIAQNSGGSLRDASTLLDQSIIYTKANLNAKSVSEMLGILDPQKLQNFFDLIIANDMDALRTMIEELADYDSEAILDDMIRFLNKQFFDLRTEFKLELLQEFFKIVADTKSLLALNADEAFVFSLMTFKMLAVTHPLDQSYSSQQRPLEVEPTNKAMQQIINSEVKAANIKLNDSKKLDDSFQGLEDIKQANHNIDKAAQFKTQDTVNHSDTKAISSSNLNVDQNSDLNHSSKKILSSHADNISVENKAENTKSRLSNQDNIAIINDDLSAKDKFDLFIKKLYNRDKQLATIFDNKVDFINLEDDKLYCFSNASEEESNFIRTHFTIINNIKNDIFGKAIKFNVSKDKENTKKTTVQMQEQSLQNKTQMDSTMLEKPFVKTIMKMFEAEISK